MLSENWWKKIFGEKVEKEKRLGKAFEAFDGQLKLQP